MSARMRVVSLVLSSGLVLLTIAACSASSSNDGSSGSSPRPEGGAVDPEYCDTYCDAQVSSGTLQGSRADCLAQCCKDTPDGCPTTQTDSGTPTDAAVESAPLPGDSSTDGPQNECTTGADCASGCCAPATNAAGDPVGPYICKPNDAKNYDCCSGAFNFCTSPACCVKDANSNEFCALPCSGNGMCGAGHCVGYDFGSTTCKGPLACGP